MTNSNFFIFFVQSFACEIRRQFVAMGTDFSDLYANQEVRTPTILYDFFVWRVQNVQILFGSSGKYF